MKKKSSLLYQIKYTNCLKFWEVDFSLPQAKYSGYITVNESVDRAF